MSIEIVNKKELYNVMQKINLVKVKFACEDMWVVAPVLYSTEKTVEILIDASKISEATKVKDNTILKFQRQGFEYLVSGSISDIISTDLHTVTLKYILAQRVNNQRKYVRFDTNLKVIILKSNGKPIESYAKNISRGGAMLVTCEDIEMNSSIDIKIIFESGNNFNSIAKILRKSPDKDNGYSYGVEFIEINDDNNEIINKEISKYEKEYLKSLSILREYTKKDDICYDTKVSILSYDKDESYEIREVLVKLGAENFDIFHNFKYYADYFIEEKPKIVIADVDEVNSEILEVIENICETFPEMYIVLLLPLSYIEKKEELEGIPDRVDVLYKPLIYDEFEKEILKYL